LAERHRRAAPLPRTPAVAHDLAPDRDRRDTRGHVQQHRLMRRAPAGTPHSHSMVAGGFEVMSRTTRLISGTSLVIRVEMALSTWSGSRAQSAVIASSLVTGRITTG